MGRGRLGIGETWLCGHGKKHPIPYTQRCTVLKKSFADGCLGCIRAGEKRLSLFEQCGIDLPQYGLKESVSQITTLLNKALPTYHTSKGIFSEPEFLRTNPKKQEENA